MSRLSSTIVFYAVLLAATGSVSHAQSATGDLSQVLALDSSAASDVSLMLGTPSSFATSAPSGFGVTDALGAAAPGSGRSAGLSLAGAAMFGDPSLTSAKSAHKDAIDQTLDYRTGVLDISASYVDVGKLFDTASFTAPSTSSSPSMLKTLDSLKGQSGFNTNLSYDQSGTKFGLKYSSVADALASRHKLSETISMERDFDKALTLSFERTQSSSAQLNAGGGPHQTNSVLRLAYSPTRSGTVMNWTESNTLTAQGGSTNDLAVKVAQKFGTLDLTSQFESSDSKQPGGSNNAWSMQRYDISQTIRQGLSVTGFWTKKTAPSGGGSDDFDVIIKSAETRYVELAAEYEKKNTDSGPGSGKQSLEAKITPGSVGPLGPLLFNLSINDQKTACLDNETYTVSLAGQVVQNKGFDFGLTGAKYYLAYSTASTSPAVSGSVKGGVHSARTLRLVSAPTGKNGLTWTVSQQQRLDQNGQALRTASDYEAKYAVSRRMTVGVNSTYESAGDNGSFTDHDQRSANLAFQEGPSCTMIAQFVHSRCASAGMAGDDAYTITYAGPAFGTPNISVGLGEQCKYDFEGRHAYGATANVDYGWKADEQNLLNFTSKLTDWDNRGYNDTYDPSVEASGQINFQRAF